MEREIFGKKLKIYGEDEGKGNYRYVCLNDIIFQIHSKHWSEQEPDITLFNILLSITDEPEFISFSDSSCEIQYSSLSFNNNLIYYKKEITKYAILLFDPTYGGYNVRLYEKAMSSITNKKILDFMLLNQKTLIGEDIGYEILKMHHHPIHIFNFIFPEP